MTEGASGFRGAGLVLATKDFECGAFASAWLAALPEPARSRVLRCRSPRRRLESLAARTALFMLLARFGIRPEGWREAPPEGPIVETPTGTLHATLSHTSGRAAALLAPSPEGLDVEAGTPRSGWTAALDFLWGRSSGLGEALREAPEETFALDARVLWCAKEAAVKTARRGVEAAEVCWRRDEAGRIRPSFRRAGSALEHRTHVFSDGAAMLWTDPDPAHPILFWEAQSPLPNPEALGRLDFFKELRS